MLHHIEWFKKKTKFIPWLKTQVLGLSLAFSRNLILNKMLAKREASPPNAEGH
ncbi:hypothetical protein POKO110462_18830 [Pontibacter korlensis]